jgi:hypothetical protein
MAKKTANLSKADSICIPVIVSPMDNAGCLDSIVTFTWESCSEASAYRIQVILFPEYPSPYFLIDTVVASTSYTDTIRARGGPLYGNIGWRIAAVRDTLQGSWSNTNTFVVKSWYLSCPVIHPLPTDSNFVDSVRFIWKRNACAERYFFQVSDKGSLLFEDTTMTDTTIVVHGLPFATELTWRVRPYAAGYGTRAVSNMKTFRMHHGPPPIPGVLTPLDTTETHPAVDLRWSSMGYTLSYDVLVRSAAGSIVTSDSGIIWTLYPLTGLAFDTLYTWQVRGRNDRFTGEWSAPQHFYVREHPVAVASSSVLGTCILTSFYPHPVEHSSTVRYYLPRNQMTRLSVFDILGRERYVVQGTNITSPGWHSGVLRAQELGPGVYFLRLETEVGVIQSKFLVTGLSYHK